MVTRLVLVRIELGAGRRVDLAHLVALQRRDELAQRGVHAFEHLLGGRAGQGDGSLQAVLDRQQAVGKALDGVLAGLGHFLVRAAARVLGLCLRAQVGVGQLGDLGFQLGDARRVGIARIDAGGGIVVDRRVQGRLRGLIFWVHGV